VPIPENLEEMLRRLTIGDETTVDRLMRGELSTTLGAGTTALVGIAALVAIEAEATSYQVAVDNAHAAGVEDEEIIETVITLLPLVGTGRLESALRGLGVALGAGLPST
jgi:alkylhydroperoxidase/carboxymuconolactone decarboxylase family protein YurZ